MVEGIAAWGKQDRFAVPPWTRESEEWQALDRRLPADHRARRIERAVALLDWGPLLESYLGVGKKALPPDLLLKAVWYAMQSKRPSPAPWAKDVQESEPVRWLLFGMEPSRARLYDFRDRLAPFWQEWNAQVLHVALEENLTPATRVARWRERGRPRRAAATAPGRAVAETASGHRRELAASAPRRNRVRTTGLAGGDRDGVACAAGALPARCRGAAGASRGQCPEALRAA